MRLRICEVKFCFNTKCHRKSHGALRDISNVIEHRQAFLVRRVRAVVSDGVVVILGDMSDNSWDVVRLPSQGGKARKLGTLKRRPYDRLRMVSRGGQAFFTLDDKVYRVR